MLAVVLISDAGFSLSPVEFGFAALVGGAGWFFHGFRSYRTGRKVADTPLSRCGARAVGVGAVYGKAHADRLFPALFSGLECIFSQATIEKWEGTAERGSWVHVATILHPPQPSFTLQDQTGSLSVLAAGATFQLLSTHYQTGDSMADDGAALLEMHDPSGTARYRIDEKSLDQDASIYVYGFATEASMVTGDAQSADVQLPKDQLVVWDRPKCDGFLIADEAPQALAADLNRSATFAVIGGPAAVLVGVGLIAWTFFSSPVGSNLPFVSALAAHPATTAIASLANVNQQAPDGTTQLIRAAQAGNAPQIQQLLRAGADPNFVDVRGRTALHYAVLARSQPALGALLTANPLLNLQDLAGDTPLHLAARLGDVALVNELLAAGADTTVSNLARQTPLDVARTSRARSASAVVIALRNALHS